MTLIWFVIWLIANNSGGHEPLALDPVNDMRCLRPRLSVMGERRRRTPTLERAELLGLLVVEAVRVDPVDDDQVELPADGTEEVGLELEYLVHGHLLRQGNVDEARSRGIAEEVGSSRACTPTEPIAATSPIVQGAASIASACPVERPSARHELGGERRVAPREVDDLADRASSFAPGAAATK